MFDNNLWTQEAGTNAAGMNYGTLSPVLPVAWSPADISTAAAGAHHQQAAGDGNSFAVPPLKRWARVHWISLRVLCSASRVLLLKSGGTAWSHTRAAARHAAFTANIVSTGCKGADVGLVV